MNLLILFLDNALLRKYDGSVRIASTNFVKIPFCKQQCKCLINSLVNFTTVALPRSLLFDFEEKISLHFKAAN